MLSLRCCMAKLRREAALGHGIGFCFDSFICNPLHAARRVMAAALPLPSRGTATGFSKLTFSCPEPACAVIVGYPRTPPHNPPNGNRVFVSNYSGLLARWHTVLISVRLNEIRHEYYGSISIIKGMRTTLKKIPQPQQRLVFRLLHVRN